MSAAKELLVSIVDLISSGQETVAVKMLTDLGFNGPQQVNAAKEYMRFKRFGRRKTAYPPIDNELTNGRDEFMVHAIRREIEDPG
jgi:hypothetical protein